MASFAAVRLMTERPQIARPRDQYTYRPGTQSVPYFAAPKVLNRPHAITADVNIPADGSAEGVLLCQGSGMGGWSFYVKDGKPHYTDNYVNRARSTVSAPDALPDGRHQVRFEFVPTGKPDLAAGKGTLSGDLITDSEADMRIAMARQ